jgi:hypothetical protein
MVSVERSIDWWPIVPAMSLLLPDRPIPECNGLVTDFTDNGGGAPIGWFLVDDGTFEEVEDV